MEGVFSPSGGTKLPSCSSDRVGGLLYVHLKGMVTMSAIKLKENLYSVGVLNPSLRVFDIVMEARYGTSYNAYLITGEKNVLVETVEANFFDEYLDNIQSVVDISKIDYLIMNHTEPDHSGSVAKLLEKNPNITVVCTTAAQKYLRAIKPRLPLHCSQTRR